MYNILYSGLLFYKNVEVAGPYLGFFVWGVANSAHTSDRGLPYTDRVSSWKFSFSPLRRKLPLRPLKKTKHTESTLRADFLVN